jgi:hypothetical protein
MFMVLIRPLQNDRAGLTPMCAHSQAYREQLLNTDMKLGGGGWGEAYP